eukprot:SAG31_NODE_4136_length_3549_cov_13.673333_2_plen_101_part_00
MQYGIAEGKLGGASPRTKRRISFSKLDKEGPQVLEIPSERSFRRKVRGGYQICGQGRTEALQPHRRTRRWHAPLAVAHATALLPSRPRPTPPAEKSKPQI